MFHPSYRVSTEKCGFRVFKEAEVPCLKMNVCDVNNQNVTSIQTQTHRHCPFKAFCGGRRKYFIIRNVFSQIFIGTT